MLGCNASQQETSSIDGYGYLIVKKIIASGAISEFHVWGSGETGYAIKVADALARYVFAIKGDGSQAGRAVIVGNFGVHPDFTAHPVSVVHEKASTGAPSGTVPAGVMVLNTYDNALYISMGGGTWKTITLT